MKNSDILSKIEINCLDFQEDDLSEIFFLLKDNLPIADICGNNAEEMDLQDQFNSFVYHIEGFDLVVKYEGEVIGYGQLENSNEYYATLYDFVIKTEYRKNGIGKCLLDEFKAYGKRYDMDKILIASSMIENKEDALSFFMKEGFSLEKDREDIYSFDIQKGE